MVEEVGARLALKNRQQFSRGMKDSKEEVDRFSGSLDGAGKKSSLLGRMAGGAVTGVKGLTGAVGSAVAGVGRLAVGIAKVGVAAGAVFLGTALKKGFDRLNDIEDATASLTIILGGAAEAASFMDEVLETVKGTPFNLDQFATAGKNLVAFGADAAKVPGYLTAIGEAAAASGKGAEAVDGIVDSLGKAQASGRIYMNTVNELSARGVPALQILANSYGVTTEKMREMVSKGAVPAGEGIDKLTKGIMEGTDGAAGATVAFAGSMEGLRGTFRGALGGMGAATARFGAGILAPFMSMATGGMGGFADTLDAAGGRASAFAQRAADAFVALGGRLSTWWGEHGPAVLDGFATIRDRGVAAFDALRGWWDDNGATIIGAVSTAAEGVVTAFQAVRAWWDDNSAAIISMATDVGDRIGAVFDTVGSAARDVVSLINDGDWGTLGEKVGGAIVDGLGAVGGAGGQIAGILIGWFAEVNWGDIGISIGQAAWPLLTGLVVGLANIDFGAIFSVLADNWMMTLGAVIGIVFTPAKFMGPLMKAIARIPFVGRLINWGITAIRSFGGAILRGIGTALGSFGRGFVNALGLQGGRVMPAIRGFLNRLPNAIRDMASTVGLRVMYMMERLGGTMARLGPQQVVRGIQAIRQALTRAFSRAGTWLVDAGRNIVRGLWDGIRGMASQFARNVGNFVTDTIPGVVRRVLNIQSPSRVMVEQGRMVAAGLAVGMQQGAGLVTGAAAGLSAISVNPQVSPTFASAQTMPMRPARPSGDARPGGGGLSIGELNLYQRDGEDQRTFAKRVVRALADAQAGS
jgi:tape measure domain-containing protein